MKYLLLILITLSACAHSKTTAKVKELSLIEARSRSFTSGMQQNDGRDSGTSYNFIFTKPEAVIFEKVWIYQVSYAFDEFDRDGDYYVTVQVFSGNRDNVLLDKMPLTTKASAVIQYSENGETKYFEVAEITEKKEVISQ